GICICGVDFDGRKKMNNPRGQVFSLCSRSISNRQAPDSCLCQRIPDGSGCATSPHEQDAPPGGIAAFRYQTLHKPPAIKHVTYKPPACCSPDRIDGANIPGCHADLVA